MSDRTHCRCGAELRKGKEMRTNTCAACMDALRAAAGR